MKIKRLEHVAIAVKDIDKSMAMLESVFGFKLDYREQVGTTKLAMYPVGETFIEFVQTVAPDSRIAKWIGEKGDSIYHLCFEVEDIDEALAELKQKGVALLDETPRTGHGGSRIAFLDPESTGNILIELAQLPDTPHP
jgi:methylmalonyl-CoA/ethylmalonyl-CoA epimerase